MSCLKKMFDPLTSLKLKEIFLESYFNADRSIFIGELKLIL